MMMRELAKPKFKRKDFRCIQQANTKRQSKLLYLRKVLFLPLFPSLIILPL